VRKIFCLTILFCAVAARAQSGPQLGPVAYQNYTPAGSCVLPAPLVVQQGGVGAGVYQCKSGTWQQVGSGASGLNQLTGDGTAGPGSGSQIFTLATVVTPAGPCGDATHVCQVTYDAKGRITAVSAISITGSGGGAVLPFPGVVFGDSASTGHVASESDILPIVPGAPIGLYSGGVTYKLGDFAWDASGNYYQSLVSSNTGNALPVLPTQATSFWRFVAPNAGIIAGGNCTSQFVTGISTAGVPTCATVTVPIASGVTGLGTGVATALASAATGSGSPVLAVSPAMTGTPTAPTATVGTNTTQLATTAFVLANASGLTNPMATLGDTLYGGASGVATRLAGATAGAGTYVVAEQPSSSTAVAPVFLNLATYLASPPPIGATTPNAITGTGFYPASVAAGPGSYYFNDFLAIGDLLKQTIGAADGSANCFYAGLESASANHPGVIDVISSATVTGTGVSCAITAQQSAGQMKLAALNTAPGWTWETDVSVTVLPGTHGMSYQAGLSNSLGVVPWTSGQGFYLSSANANANNWYCSHGTSSLTFVDSGVTVTAQTYYRLSMVQDGTNLHWYINGTQVCGTGLAIASVQPTAGIEWESVELNTTTSGSMGVDYVTFTRAVTR
jgi:hypothetical protein